jgi:hypothetical protein
MNTKTKKTRTNTLQSIRNSLELGVKCGDLTDARASVLTYVLQCWASGFLPTIREICDEFGWSSPNAAVQHLHALRRAGYIADCEDGKSAMMLTDKSLDLVL